MTEKQKIIELGAHERMSPMEALDYIKRKNPRELMIIGYDEDGAMIAVTSKLTRADALCLACWAQRHAMGLDE